MENFKYLAPSSLSEAISILAKEKGRAKILAGGTDLLPSMIDRKVRVDTLVSLKRIQELRRIEEKKRTILIGATCTLREIEESSLVRNCIPILSYTIREMGSWQIRNRGTIGGNLCNASPAADTAAPLLVLGSEIVLQGPKGRRKIALSDFFIGPGETVLKGDEILTKISIPKPIVGSGVYIKLGRRRAMEIAIAGVAVWLVQRASDRKTEEVRIALSSVGPTPFRAYEAELRLKGERMERRIIEKASEIACQISKPITDIRGTEEYRREMVKVLTKRAVLEAMDRAKGGGS